MEPTTNRWMQQLVVVPKSLQQEILITLHENLEAGHTGKYKMTTTALQKFYWKGMRNDIQNWVDTCITCQMRKNPRRTQTIPNSSIPPAATAFDFVVIDVVKLTKTPRGNNAALVISDFFTRWPEAFPIKDEKAITIAKIMVDEIICHYGAPLVLLSDRGTNFLSHICQAIYKIFAIQKRNTTAFNPQCNGLCEKLNGTLVDIMAKYTQNNQKDWDLYLPFALLAYRSSVHTTTKLTPYFALFGREMNMPMDVALQTTVNQKYTHVQKYVKDLKSKLIFTKNLQQQLYIPPHEMIVPINFSVGSLVMVYLPQLKKGEKMKSHLCWKGPYEVLEKVGPINYRCRLYNSNKKSKIFRVDKLKKYNIN